MDRPCEQAMSPVPEKRPRASFIYVDEAVLSGQRRATELLVAALEQRGWVCLRLPMPGLDRRGFPLLALCWCSLRVACAWLRAIVCFLDGPMVLHVNLGQSLAAMLREGTPLFFYSLFHGPSAVISLHGSWFMSWTPGSLRARWLSALAERATVITVLGPDQKQRLVEFGVPEAKLEVVDNTCELLPIDEAALAVKHSYGQRVQVMFLSNLVDTKGYPEFLDAMEHYSRRTDAVAVDMVLCGKFISASHSTRYHTEEAAMRFIEERLSVIGASGRVTVQWVTEAENTHKWELFRNTQLFVFPSKLEAQPLVLIEAMASGCSIISSGVGQIPRMLAGGAGLLLASLKPQDISDVIAELVRDPERRLRLAETARRRFMVTYTQEIFGERWNGIMRRNWSTFNAPRRRRPTIWFFYADTPGFSGQKEASRLIFDHLRTDIWQVRQVKLPALNRSGGLIADLGKYVSDILGAAYCTLVATFRAGSIVHLTLGQTRWSLVRDGIPFLMVMALRSGMPAIASINGSNFMSWSYGSFQARLFRLILRHVRYLTVLGESQRQQAQSLGIPAYKLRVLPNSCDAQPLTLAQVEQKQAETGPLRLLHLSSLIDTKGYPAFLEALLKMGDTPGRPIEAVLCGSITISQFSARFTRVSHAREWIERIIARINATARVRVRWIDGAHGEAKWQLFREAHVFVFPSEYKVEAQPLVLLEAMAHGCAIVTTLPGEVRALVGDSTAEVLHDANASTVTQALRALDNDARRRSLAVNGWKRYTERFTREAYLQQWENLFRSLDV